ncbi:hypothetical protein EUX98_g2991 [Antrodiella citrinella]|uniref:SAM domain-containing protein n=1 Tax=Antrodiella citrinella TaxID=2447956 RepID=A0A4S4MXP6_9APHY|nr:hypothetical protein EUX98_g2991 [Antrodiella citrinella]
MSAPSPRNPDLNPNPHPYAIKTTSTGLLSRSSSTGFNTNASKNHYVPLSPSPTRSSFHGNEKKHRATKSQYIPESSPTKAPRPLPAPPAFSSGDGHGSTDEASAPRRARRADTLPSVPSSAPSPFINTPIPVSVVDLPYNPKLWTPSELSSYLATALRVTSPDKTQESSDVVVLPARVAKDIATFVREMSITGRTFLRLNEDDLNIMGVNQKWREALLLASRNLRQNVIKGRIWGPDLDPELESITSPSSSRPGSTSPSRPLPNPPLYANPEYNSSASSIEELPQPSPQSGRLRRKNGRVQGMVASFERSGSFSSDAGGVDEGKPSATLLDSWRDEVRDMDTDNDATSFSSRSSPEYDTTFIAESTVADAEEEMLVQVKDAAEYEPTIEELLAGPGPDADILKRRSWGARAWEELEAVPGLTTVKRIPTDEVVNGVDTVVANGSGKSSSGRGRREEQRRIVTAIFTPPVEAPPLPVGPEESALDPVNLASIPQDVLVEDHLPHSSNEQALLDELAETKALVAAFRARLEVVEQKVDALEQKERLTSHIEPEPTLGSALYTQASSLIPSFASSLVLSRRSRNSIRNAPAVDPENDDADRAREPASVSDIPAYVLLVGIGVCAVVLKVMLKRVGDRRG